jgi:hypothetical protein
MDWKTLFAYIAGSVDEELLEGVSDLLIPHQMATPNS